MKKMKIDFIRTFIMLSEIKSYSHLSKKLDISQSTLSNRIIQLENDFEGIKLINRTTRSFILSKEGEIFLKYAKKIIEEYDNCKRKLSDFSNKIIDNIIITASTLPGSHILPKFITQFRGKYPNINLISRSL